MKVHSTLSGGRATLDMLDGLPQELAFPVEEYEARLAAVREGMRARDVEVLVVQHPANVLYLTGYQTFSSNAGECVVVPLEGDPTLLVPPPELGGALVHTWLDDRRGYAPGRSEEQYIADTLRDKGLDGAKIGVEKASDGLPAGTFDSLVAALPKVRFIDGSGIVDDVKTVKSPREIEHIRNAARTTDAGMAAAIEAAREGASDNDMAAAASEAIVAAGSEYMCVSPIVTSGRRSGILHSTHKRNRLERGDVVLLEWAAAYTGTRPRRCGRSSSASRPPRRGAWPSVSDRAGECIGYHPCGYHRRRGGAGRLGGHELGRGMASSFTATSAMRWARASRRRGRTARRQSCPASTPFSGPAWSSITPSHSDGWHGTVPPSARRR